MALPPRSTLAHSAVLSTKCPCPNPQPIASNGAASSSLGSSLPAAPQFVYQSTAASPSRTQQVARSVESRPSPRRSSSSVKPIPVTPTSADKGKGRGRAGLSSVVSEESPSPSALKLSMDVDESDGEYAPYGVFSWFWCCGFPFFAKRSCSYSLSLKRARAAHESTRC